MVRRIKVKAVLRLDGRGLSGRAMAGSLGIAGLSVSGTPGVAKTAGVGWDDVADRPDGEVYALLFPGRGEREGVCGRPGWAGVRRELARVGVTLGILHGGYVDGCRRAGRPCMGCDRFCRLYAARVPELGVTGGVGHKAGRAIEVGWAGRTMRIVDPVTGDSSAVCLFVGVLPSGRYAFAGPALDMTRNTWLRARVAVYGWFGGSAPRLVCDDLRTGVIRHPREGGIVLNDAYRGMAGHCSAAVLPGRVERPKDRPSAENTVWHRDHGAGRGDARPRVRFAGRAAYGDTRMARGIQRAPFPEARRLPAFRVRIGGEAAVDRVAANAVRGGGPGVRQEGAGQRPCSVGAQLVFRPVRVRRLHRGPGNRCGRARGPAREHRALRASAPARHRCLCSMFFRRCGVVTFCWTP